MLELCYSKVKVDLIGWRITLLASVFAFFAISYPGVIMAGKLPFPLDCSNSSVYFTCE